MRRGARRRLAELKETDTAGDRIQTKRWRFSPTVLEWCNQVLAAAVPCDLLVVDELGPLEFERNQGLLNGFRVVDSGMYRVSLTVVRPSLLSKARERWPGAEVVLLDMNPDISKIIEEFVQST
jgi:hypothetical protein